MDIKITDVRAHPGDSAFLVDDGRTAILLDSGFAFTGHIVANKIENELGDRRLDYIFLTHSHYDHALGSVYAKRRWPEVKVVASEYAACVFTRPSAKRVMRELDRKIAAKCGITEYEDLIDELGVDIAVKDGDIIEAGAMRFTVISLPGHTKCSVGYYLSGEKFLLSSETIGVYTGSEEVFPSYLIGYGVTMDSIAKAEKLDIDRILLPHFGVLSCEETEVYLKNARLSAAKTADSIAAILRRGGTKAAAIEFVKDKFYVGHVKTLYPVDAMELNTAIMVDLIEKELVEAK